MADIKRITPDEVVAAYDKTGLGVMQGGYFDADGTCACGMGVYAAARFGVDPRNYHAVDIDLAFIRVGFTREYLRGFYNGFDGRARERGHAQEDLGRADGVAAYEATQKEAARGFDV